MSWFAAGEYNSPIMKFYIINTDWSLRCRHIDNCIHANSFRNQERASVRLTPNSLTNGFIPNGIGAIVLVTGQWLLVRINDTPYPTRSTKRLYSSFARPSYKQHCIPPTATF